MASTLKKIVFPYKEMKVEELFFNQEILLPTEAVKHEVVRTVFGRDLMFGEIPSDRPYTFNSLVTSVDGRIAFDDDKAGPLVARNNKYAGAGGMLDYWVLNLLRGSSDAILVGTNSISVEKNSGGTGHCYDEHIENRREELGIDPVPWRVVVTMDGRDVVFSARQFTEKAMSTFFYTTSEGVEYLKEHSIKDTVVIGPFNSQDEVVIEEFSYDSSKAYIIVTSDSGIIDNKMGMKILREIGVRRLLVESPTITHIFMQEQLIDELFLNQSGLYIGGKGLAIGQSCEAFTSVDHPHTNLLSIHMHSPSFIYMRYKILY